MAALRVTWYVLEDTWDELEEHGMIWLWVILAFLAGGVIAYWLCTRARADEQSMAPAPNTSASTARIASLPEAVAEPVPEPIDPDDLRKIEGIGPKIAELINGGGIITFTQLASTPVERLQEILDSAGERFRVHNPATWPMQAGMAAEGKWDELQELQDRLDGGKIV